MSWRNEYFPLGRESINRKGGRNNVMRYISQLSFIVNSWRWSALIVKCLLRLGPYMTCLLLLAHVRAAYCGMITRGNSSLVQTKTEKEQKEEKWSLSYHHLKGIPVMWIRHLSNFTSLMFFYQHWQSGEQDNRGNLRSNV